MTPPTRHPTLIADQGMAAHRRPTTQKSRILCALLITSVALTSGAPPETPAAAASPSHPRWQLPVAAPLHIVRPFIAPEHRYAPGHRGVDLDVGDGANVTAPASGTVHFAGVVVDRPVLSIRHADGYLSSFEPLEASVEQGQAVVAGETIGTLGRSTHCSGDDSSTESGGCLHIGVRLNGDYLNPLIFFGLDARPVLLPVGDG